MSASLGTTLTEEGSHLAKGAPTMKFSWTSAMISGLIDRMKNQPQQSKCSSPFFAGR